ncbi:MAG: GerMN domain-containing protein [Coriobacteriia bacterium]
MRRTAMLLLFVLVPALLVTGCSGTTPDGPAPSNGDRAQEETPTDVTSPDAPADGEEREVVIYLMGDDEKVHPYRRQIEGAGVASGAISALLAGASQAEKAAGASSSIPAGTRLLGVSLDGGVASVDLSREFGGGGGSLSIMSRVAQVVFTATQFSTIESVVFEIEGEPLDSLGGEGLLLQGPQTRAQWEEFAPAILVEEPVRGDTATMGQPLLITGSANVFEAQFKVEVTDGDGLIIVSTPVMATSGSGERGTFQVNVTPKGGKNGFGAVVVSYDSPKDGSRVVIDEIPIEFK